MFIGLRTAKYAGPDIARTKEWYIQATADAHAAHKRLLSLGATPDEPITDVGEGILIGSVKDPFGNVLGIIQNPHFKGGK